MTGSSSHLDTVVVVESLGDVWPSEIVLPSATTQCIAATEMREGILWRFQLTVEIRLSLL